MTSSVVNCAVNMSVTVCWGGRVGLLATLPSLSWVRGARLAPQPFQQKPRRAQRCAAASEPSAEGQTEGQNRLESVEAEFSSMLPQLKAWKDRYYNCIVPRKV
jgi:hypothetical protein